MERERIVVAGAGIIGASIAAELAERGALVTVIDAESPGSGASSKSFGWVNAGWENEDYEYYRLRRASMRKWWETAVLRLGSDTYDIESGASLRWSRTEEEERSLRRQIGRLRSWGYPLVEFDLDELPSYEEEELDPGRIISCIEAPAEFVVDPRYANPALVDAARRAGAQVLPSTRLTAIRSEGGLLTGIETSGGPIDCGTLVIACGAATGEAAALAGLEVPLVESPGILARAESPADTVLTHVIRAPGVTMRNTFGSIVLSGGFGADDPADATEAYGTELIARAAECYPPASSMKLQEVTVGYRPMPADGFPIVGFDERAPGVYLAVMHSGVTLAPIIAELAATEILDGVAVEMLARYRLARFG